MKTIQELSFGFSDANEFSHKKYKNFFNDVFFDENDINRLQQENVYFLIGEKGTGKTACAIYLKNNEKNNISSYHKYVRETEYAKFIAMKNEKSLVLSDYTSIWKVMLYLLISEQIYKDSKSWSNTYNKFKFEKLIKCIDSFYNNAFQPEFIQAIEFADKAEIVAKTVIPSLNVKLSASEANKNSISNFQTSLFAIEKLFRETLSSLKLKKNHYLFIDGIDFRPFNIEYNDYLDCVKGLANAVWSLNSDFFSQIKDSEGRIKIVLLARPDIFNSFGLQNKNTKIKDNSLLLSWKTKYPNYKTSKLYSLVNKYLSYEQKLDNDLWDNYFNFTIENYRGDEDNPFIYLLRKSLFRPREILTMLGILKNLEVESGNTSFRFTKSIMKSSEFEKEFSNFMLGEIKDHMSFYYTDEEYELFLKFFMYLNGRATFDYNDFCDTFKRFKDSNEEELNNSNLLPNEKDKFLQLLYELDIICAIQYSESGDKFFSWCHRDRTPSNISPKVSLNSQYEVHYSLRKALNLGARFR